MFDRRIFEDMGTRKAQPKSNTPVLVRGNVTLGITIPSTDHESGMNSETYGDEVYRLSVNGSRHTVAERLRILADVIGNVYGNPVSDAAIVVLLRHPKANGS